MHKKILITAAVIGCIALTAMLFHGRVGHLSMLENRLFMAASFGSDDNAVGKKERTAEETALLSSIKAIYDQVNSQSLTHTLVAALDREYAQALSTLPATDATAVLRANFRGDALRRLDARVKESFAVLLQKLPAIDTLSVAEKRALGEEKRRLLESLGALFEAVKALPRMNAVMTVSATGGRMPLAVELSAIGSSDPMRRTIAPQSFHWSYVDHTQKLVSLGTGVEKVVTFEHPGVYVVRLTVASSLDPTVLPGIASSPEIRVNPPETTADFSVNGYFVPNSGTAEVSVTDARKGLRFDPTLSKVAAERKIVSYEWNINGRRQTLSSPDPIIEKFDLSASGSGQGSLQQILGTGGGQAPSEQTVDATLRVTDNIGGTSTKSVRLVIRKSIAVIRVLKNGKAGKFELRTSTPITFDGSSSAVENTPSTQYTWTLTDPNGGQKNFFDQSFDHVFEGPGEYTLELMVGNGFKTKETYMVLPLPPPAIFSWAIVSPSQPATVRFDATESRDIRGRPLFYSWDFDGDGKYEIQSSPKQTVSWSYGRPAAYLVKLAVTDEFGETSINEKLVEITSALNVDFTADSFAVQPGKEAVFRADAPNAIRFVWDFGDGTTKESEQVAASHTYPFAGQKAVTLTAYDAAGNANSVTKTLVVGDGVSPVPQVAVSVDGELRKPVKNLCGPGKDAYSVTRSDLIEFSALESVNARGEKTGLQFAWDFQDGSVIAEGVATRKFAELSTNTRCSKAILSVQDVATGASAVSGEILVYVGNAAPSLTQLLINADQRCATPCIAELKAIGSWDADGEITEYRWWAEREGDPEKIGFTATKEPEAVIIIPARGATNEENTYYFTVELVDDAGKSVTSAEVFGHRSEPRTVVNADNPRPTLDFSVNRPIVYAGEAAIFTADAKDPQSQEIPASAFAWDFDGDGTYDDTSSGPRASHTFPTPGRYLVTLRLRVRGIEATKEHEISVVEQSPYPRASFFYIREGDKITFDGSESKADPKNAANELFYVWDFDILTDSNGNGSADDDADAQGVKVEYQYPATGKHTTRLTVTDSAGNSHFVEQVVEAAPGNSQPKSLIPATRTPRLIFNIPAATLELLVKKSPSTDKNAFDIIIFGRDVSGAPLSGVPKISFSEGDAQILLPPDAFTDGFSTARISVDGETAPIIEVSAATQAGIITERVILPQTSLSST